MQIIKGKVVKKPDATTVIVEVVRKTPHPLYRKLLKHTKKFTADNNGMDVVLGSSVSMIKTRPLSKRKHFQLVNSDQIGVKEAK